MPEHLYRPRYDPPRWWEHILAHAFETMIAGYCLVTGVLIFLSLLQAELHLSSALESVAWWVQASLGLLFLLGGTTSILGLLDPFADFRDSAYVIRAAQMLQAMAFALHVVVQFFDRAGANVDALTLSLVLSIGMLLSYIASRVSAPRIESVVRQRRRRAARGGESNGNAG